MQSVNILKGGRLLTLQDATKKTWLLSIAFRYQYCFQLLILFFVHLFEVEQVVPSQYAVPIFKVSKTKPGEALGDMVWSCRWILLFRLEAFWRSLDDRPSTCAFLWSYKLTSASPCKLKTISKWPSILCFPSNSLYHQRHLHNALLGDFVHRNHYLTVSVNSFPPPRFF